MTARFEPEAEAELHEAVAYYDRQRPGLGREFAREIARGIKRISDSPRAWKRIEGDLRSYRINRFPYGLIYGCDGEDVVIVAVAHLHRRPGYWRYRIR